MCARAILAPDLEPISFDDLPLGGEWTTRRRTISESEIALFAAVAGDFSPLTIDSGHAGGRFAPPALLVATAIGLGTMDMPVPSIAEWEWFNWKFPRPVRAGDTIYARWTLTQKRPPVGSAPTAIAVWRVDVHTADGALCAEGEVGASVRRHVGVGRAVTQGAEAQPAAPSRRRRGRRTTLNQQEPKPAPKDSQPKPPVAEPSATPRRRRRRRSRAGAPARDAPGSTPPASAPEPSPAPPPVPAIAAAAPRGALGRVIKRLRRS
ncbi:MAG TPA: MaoC family dehydratase [Candidatus Dormibacteraeota bacterium]|jgi:acyl dehydratase